MNIPAIRISSRSRKPWCRLRPSACCGAPTGRTRARGKRCRTTATSRTCWRNGCLTRRSAIASSSITHSGFTDSTEYCAKIIFDPCRNRPSPFDHRVRTGDLSFLTTTRQETTMRFMVMVKATKDSEAGRLPSAELLNEMGKFNEELVKAGVMQAGEGLQPSSKGARVRFSGAKRTVFDGPFAETKELVAGFWIWKVKNLQEAIEWVKK